MNQYLNLEYEVIRIIESKLVLPGANLAEILKRWKEMNSSKYNDQKKGGTYGSEGRTAWWYAWMPEDYDKSASSVEEILGLMHFSVTEDESSHDIWIIDFFHKSTGVEELFFKHIADLIPQGQYVLWQGEDGRLWRWYFTGTELRNQKATLLYEDD